MPCSSCIHFNKDPEGTNWGAKKDSGMCFKLYDSLTQEQKSLTWKSWYEVYGEYSCDLYEPKISSASD